MSSCCSGLRGNSCNTTEDYFDAWRGVIESALTDALNDTIDMRTDDPLLHIAQAVLNRRRASMSTPPPLPETASDEDAWSVAGWLNSLSLHSVVSTALQPNGDAATIDFVCGLSREQIAARLHAADVEGQLATVIHEGVGTLLQQGAATGAELNSKFASEAGFEMAFGPRGLFFTGLEGLIGPPLLVQGSLGLSMEREHTACDDVDLTFTSSNGVTTSTRLEWEVVVAPIEGKRYPERARGRGMEGERNVRSLQELLPAMEERNRQLQAAKHSPMGEDELVAGRMYTGPMYEKYNLVLRSRSGVAVLRARQQELCGGNMYATTLHAINSCVAKLSKLSVVGKVWRGFKGATLPRSFWETSAEGVRGGVEYGFSSTTTDRAQALSYAAGRASTVLEMSAGMCDRGADIAWLSQYTAEAEVLFPPLLGVEVLGTAVEGSTLVVAARLSVPAVLTLEQVVSKRKKVVLDLCAQMVAELHHETKGAEWDALQQLAARAAEADAEPSGGSDGLDVVAEARAWLEARLAETMCLAPTAFNDDETLGSAVRDAVLAKRTLSAWPAGLQWLLEASSLELAALRGVTELKLKGCALGPGAAGALRVLLHVGRVRSVDLAVNDLGDEGCRCLAAALPRATSLHSLSLKGNAIGREGGRALGAALGGEGTLLTALDLTKNNLGDEGAAAVGAALSTNRVLTSLSLERTMSGDGAATALGEALSANGALLELNLASEYQSTRANVVAHAGGVALAAGLSRNGRLTSLSLFQNRTLGPDAGCALAAAVRTCTQLRVLNLLCSGQDARSVAALAEARDASMLVTLCGIDPAVLTDLSEGLSGQGLLEADALLLAAELAANATLTALNVRANDIGADGRVALESASAGRTPPLRLEL